MLVGLTREQVSALSVFEGHRIHPLRLLRLETGWPIRPDEIRVLSAVLQTDVETMLTTSTPRKEYDHAVTEAHQ